MLVISIVDFVLYIFFAEELNSLFSKDQQTEPIEQQQDNIGKIIF